MSQPATTNADDAGSRYLVVNGDDFGYNPAINEAILRCYHEGILTSTTLLVNQPASRAALVLARQHPDLGGRLAR